MSNHFNNNSRLTTKDANPASTVFKGATNPAAIYRSLEVPLPHGTPSPLLFRGPLSDPKAAFPSLKGPQTKNPGEVVWDSVQTELCPPSQGLFCPSTTSFTLTAPSPVAAIHAVLAKHHVDVTSFVGFEWTCSVFDNFVETVFVLRLFAHNLVDVQRESGCAFTFNNVYNLIKADLTGCAAAAVPPARKAFKCMALPKEMEEEGGSAAPTAFKPLLDMCASSQLDVQREGMKVLASAVEADPRATVCATSCKIMDILTQSKDAQVRRLAASSLNCLAKEGVAVVDQMVVKEEVLCALVNLVLDERELTETRRQAGRAVWNLSRCGKLAPLVKSSASPICSATIVCRDAQLDEIVGNLKGFLTVG